MVKTTKALKPDVNGELGFSEDPLNGTYYVGEGCWGAPTRNNDDDKEWTLASGSFNQIKWVWVDCERIEMRTIMTDNAEEVASLGDNIFEEPDNIELWNPESIGEVLVIQNQALSNPDFVKTNVAVYPNPFNGILNVEVPSILEKVNITLYDINGRLLLNETKKVVKGSFTINTTTISNGMVFLRISTTRGQAIATKKLLKE
jgi:hypothetical protein